jgi:hypothetical protein
MTNPSDPKKSSTPKNSTSTTSSTPVDVVSGNVGTLCRVCDKIGPMVFRNDPWCCDDHRKVIKGEILPGPRLRQRMQQSLLRELAVLWGDRW